MSQLILGLIGVTLSWALLALIVIDILRERCVPDTWRRYVYATVAWALVPPSLANAPFALLFRDNSPFLDALGVLNFVFVLLVIRRLINDDDDNYWRRKRKQLKQYLRSFGLRPSLAGAGR